MGRLSLRAPKRHREYTENAAGHTSQEQAPRGRSRGQRAGKGIKVIVVHDRPSRVARVAAVEARRQCRALAIVGSDVVKARQRPCGLNVTARMPNVPLQTR